MVDPNDAAEMARAKEAERVLFERVVAIDREPLQLERARQRAQGLHHRLVRHSRDHHPPPFERSAVRRRRHSH